MPTGPSSVDLGGAGGGGTKSGSKLAAALQKSEERLSAEILQLRQELLRVQAEARMGAAERHRQDWLKCDDGGISWDDFDNNTTNLVHTAGANMYFSLWVPRDFKDVQYGYVQKADGTANINAQRAILGPVNPPISGVRIIDPTTDSPVVLCKSADTTCPARQGAVEFDYGARYQIVPGYAYWRVIQGDPADAGGLAVQIAGPRRRQPQSGSINSQCVYFYATAGCPAYASNFAAIGSGLGALTVQSLTFDGNPCMGDG